MNDAEFNAAFERSEAAALAAHTDRLDHCEVCGRPGTELCTRCEEAAR